MTKAQKISFSLILIIGLILVGLYYNRHFYNSYLFIFSKTSDKALIKNIEILNDKGYSFVSYEKLSLDIKNDAPFERKAVVLALENKPSKPLLAFLKKSSPPLRRSRHRVRRSQGRPGPAAHGGVG